MCILLSNLLNNCCMLLWSLLIHLSFSLCSIVSIYRSNGLLCSSRIYFRLFLSLLFSFPVSWSVLYFLCFISNLADRLFGRGGVVAV